MMIVPASPPMMAPVSNATPPRTISFSPLVIVYIRAVLASAPVEENCSTGETAAARIVGPIIAGAGSVSCARGAHDDAPHRAITQRGCREYIGDADRRRRGTASAPPRTS